MARTAEPGYTRHLLHTELPEQVHRLSDHAFAEYQCARVAECHQGFQPDSLSVSVQRFTDQGVFLRTEYAGIYNHPENAYKKYLEFAHLDVMANANWVHRGSAIFNTHFMPMEEWMDDEFYSRFKEPLGFHHTVIIAYQMPFRNHFRLRFNYQTEHPKQFGASLTKADAEYITLPFMICWLYKLNVIDKDHMCAWLERLSGLTLIQLSILRHLTGRGQFDPESICRFLSIHPARFEAEMNSLRVRLKDGGLVPYDRAHLEPTLLDMANAFDFLRFAGRPETEDDLLNRLQPPVTA